MQTIRITALATILTQLLAMPTLSAQPVPGDADYPTRNGNPRHEQKVAAVKSREL